MTILLGLRAVLCMNLLMPLLAAESLSRLRLEESTDLKTWQSIAITPEMIDANGHFILPSDSPVRFYRMQVEAIKAPVITDQPAPITIIRGQIATLTVIAIGSQPLTYQWYEGTSGMTNNPIGDNSPWFDTPFLTSAKNYWVRVTNEAGSIDSEIATVKPGNLLGNSSEFVLIPAGSFTMGRTSGDTDVNSPPVSVTLSAFYIGKHEVTKALWDEIVPWATSNGYADLPTGGGKAPDHPVHSIGWLDAVKWCNARSEREGLTPCYYVGGKVMKTGSMAPSANWSSNGYRLPTEAEWEKSARGGIAGKRFPWGTDTINHSQSNYLSSISIRFDSSGNSSSFHPRFSAVDLPYTSPVGSFPANGYGIHDMAGNVCEWCWDWYGDSTYMSGSVDPRGPASEPYRNPYRIFRGGSWYSYANDCRASSRTNYFSPFVYSDKSGFGFRIARSSAH